MKKRYSFTFLVRLMSVCSLPALAAIPLLKGTLPGWQTIVSALLSASALLLMSPLTHEPRCFPTVYSGVTLVTLLTLRAASPSDVLPAMAASVFLTIYFVFLTVRKARNIKSLFNVSSVWCGVEEYARLFYSVLLQFAILLFWICLPRPVLVAWSLLPMSAVLFVLMYCRSWSGNTLIMSRKDERRSRNALMSVSRNPDAGGDPAQNAIYSRVLAYMEKDRPYLDEDFSLDEMASATYANKAYLSRTINDFSGRNFCQFVNMYRVEYAKQLLREDKNILMADVAFKSGFHTPVSFNMAFKYNVGMTPTQYRQALAANPDFDKPA